MDFLGFLVTQCLNALSQAALLFFLGVGLNVLDGSGGRIAWRADRELAQGRGGSAPGRAATAAMGGRTKPLSR